MMRKILATIYLPFNYAIRFAINWTSSQPSSREENDRKEREEPLEEILYAMFSYTIMTLFGYLNDILRFLNLTKKSLLEERNRDGFVPLYNSFENFYRRNIYTRINAAIGTPIVSIASTKTTVAERERDRETENKFFLSGKKHEVINFVSYNYLEMNQNKGPFADSVKNVIENGGIAIGSPVSELGTTRSVLELEEQLAKFLKVESSLVVGQGFSTNSTIIPALINERKCLILADELNHTSIAMGCKLSSTATVVRFKHNNMIDLENKLQEAVFGGHYKKILIIVEGIYSMEGTIVNLPEVIRLKTKYKAYLYVDEAHSIGALGRHGRGVTDHFGIDPSSVDILMGTFTKSFGAAGGYVAGKKEIIDFIKATSHSCSYASPISPPVMKQIHCALQVIQDCGPSSIGRKKLDSLAENTRYFRERLTELGFLLIGHKESAVVPLLSFSPVKTL